MQVFPSSIVSINAFGLSKNHGKLLIILVQGKYLCQPVFVSFCLALHIQLLVSLLLDFLVMVKVSVKLFFL